MASSGLRKQGAGYLCLVNHVGATSPAHPVSADQHLHVLYSDAITLTGYEESVRASRSINVILTLPTIRK